MDKQALIDMAGTDECMNPATIRQATKDLSLDDFRFVLHATRIHKLILDGEMDRAALAASQLAADGHRAADGQGLTIDDFMPQEDTEEENEVAYEDGDEDGVFGRVNIEGNIVLLRKTDGLPVTRMENWSGVYPLGSRLSCAYEHPKGIQLDRYTAGRLGVDIEE